MNNLVKILNQDGQLVVTSRQIAEDFEKNHRDVLENIDQLVKGVAEKSAGLFIPTEYQHEQNKQTYREYLLTRDGFSLLVMGFTGEKALQWKLKYIEAFNMMEQSLKQQKQITSSADKQKLAEAKLNNSKARKANILLKIANNVDGSYKQVLMSYASAIIVDKPLIPLPVVEEKTYTAEEIGKQLGISGNKVGRIAIANNLKTEQYGKLYHDKSKYSCKEVESFRYYENVIPVIKTLLEDGGTQK